MLLTAARYGERVYVGVTDDMPGADTALRESSARGVMERAALRGGALEVAVRPCEGTTMTLRLAAALNTAAGSEDGLEAIRPDQGPPASPMIPSMEGNQLR